MQLFHRSTNTISRVSIFGFVFIVAGLGWMVLEVNRSSYVTGAYEAKEQPVPFSHKHHVAGLGIDCRYCHTSVEISATAGLPPTKTCMNCHAQIWTNAAMLEPVRASFRDNKSIQWTRVHDLPDFSFFNHSIHVAKGFGCTTCHGPVDQMPLVWQTQSLQMEWCLNCHREPEMQIRPKEQVFSTAYQPPSREKPVMYNGEKFEDQRALGRKLVADYKVRHLTYCSACHR